MIPISTRAKCLAPSRMSIRYRTDATVSLVGAEEVLLARLIRLYDLFVLVVCLSMKTGTRCTPLMFYCFLLKSS